MPYGRITPKQQEILDYIKNEILNRGFPPAVREICEAVNLKSTSSVHSHLEALEKNGYIRRDATKPRAIEIIDDNFNLVRREVVNVPIIGTVAAGQPLLAVENIEGYFPIPAEFMPNSQSFLLKVKGESMINAGTGSAFIRWSGISMNSAISLYFAAHIPRITPKTMPAIRPVPIFIMLCISVT